MTSTQNLPMNLAEADRLRAHLHAVRCYHADLRGRIASGDVADPEKSHRYLLQAEADVRATLIKLSDGGWI